MTGKNVHEIWAGEHEQHRRHKAGQGMQTPVRRPQIHEKARQKYMQSDARIDGLGQGKHEIKKVGGGKALSPAQKSLKRDGDSRAIHFRSATPDSYHQAPTIPHYKDPAPAPTIPDRCP